MRFEENRCDRCGCSLPHAAMTMTLAYHHPPTLELCVHCDEEFTLWLGKHPLWQISLTEGVNNSGSGWPSSERIKEYLRDKVAK